MHRQEHMRHCMCMRRNSQPRGTTCIAPHLSASMAPNSPHLFSQQTCSKRKAEQHVLTTSSPSPAAPFFTYPACWQRPGPGCPPRRSPAASRPVCSPAPAGTCNGVQVETSHRSTGIQEQHTWSPDWCSSLSNVGCGQGHSNNSKKQ